MRQIKFRGKRIDNGEWVYGNYFTTPLSDENSGLPPENGWYFLTGEKRHCIGQNGCAYVIDPFTLGLLSGFLDKTGKEIYSGDIVKSDYGDDSKSVIEYGEYKDATAGDIGKSTNIGFYFESPEGVQSPFGKSYNGLDSYVTIIGNIHDKTK